MNVLIADDESVSRRLLESCLRRWGYDVVVASDGLEVSRILRQPNPPKLLVLDWLMPGIDGIQLCREIRRFEKEGSYTYVLLLTTKRTTADVVEGLESGADDYLTKPFDPHELKVQLRTGRRILHLMDQLVAAREALREMAMHDSLTGIWNRAAVLDALETELMRARRHESSLGVVMLDLDRFKAINDMYGHAAGDAVLRETARAIAGCIRSYDSFGRYGGEEFLLVLPGCDQRTAVGHAERFRNTIGQLAVETERGLVHVTASFGVTVGGNSSDADAEMLVKAADEALYRAKRGGRDRVEFNGVAELPATWKS
jgi:diguanylate cyclase (GGDEF)-like protein